MVITYKNPALAVDVIVEIGQKIVLISRNNPPLGWAIPGGFVDEGETTEDAAIREVYEEIGLHVTLETLLGVYSNPERDPRKHIVSIVYVGQASGTPQAADDAREARLFNPRRLPTLCFDHALILKDYRHFRKTGERPLPRPLSRLEEGNRSTEPKAAIFSHQTKEHKS